MCALAVQAYEAITSDADAQKALMQYRSQRHAFIQTVSNRVKTSNFYSIVKNLSCKQMHKNFEIILQIAFNCLAKNELKQLNQSQMEAPAKMTRTVKRLRPKVVKSVFFMFCFKWIIFYECVVQICF